MEQLVGNVCQQGVIEMVDSASNTVVACNWRMERVRLPRADVQLVDKPTWVAVPPRAVMLPYAIWNEMVRVWNCPLIDENNAFTYHLPEHKQDIFVLTHLNSNYGALTRDQSLCIPTIALDNVIRTHAREPVSAVPGDYVVHDGRWRKLLEVAIWKTRRPGWTGRVADCERDIALAQSQVSNGSGMFYRYAYGLLIAENRPPLKITATAEGIVLKLF